MIPDQMRDKRNDPMAGFLELMKEDQRAAIRDMDPIDRPLPEE